VRCDATMGAALTLLEGGDVHTPHHLGVASIVMAGESILAVGEVNRSALERSGVDVEVVDASGCLVVPALVDAHEHVLGAAGEEGYETRTGPVTADELTAAGIGAVVGCLGSDVTTRNLPALLGKVRELSSFGLAGYMHTGGFHVPPDSLTGDVMHDLVIVPEVVGLGELGIGDERALDRTVDQLLALLSKVMVGGRIASKKGVLHLHLGSLERGRALIRSLITEHEAPPAQIYATHINRDGVIEFGAELSRYGAFVDIDAVDDAVPRWIGAFCDAGGRLEQLTVSSDARTDGGEPSKLLRALRDLVGDGWPLEAALPLFTRNPATALGLRGVGTIEPGAFANVLVVEAEGLGPRHLWCRGRATTLDA
jgi:beta-aspartyl-dipeptidase (metallo-type)